MVVTRPARAAAPSPPRLYTSQRLRFALDAPSLAEAGVSGSHALLLVEDPHGLACLCPSRRDPAFVPVNGRWLLPGPERGGFYLDEPQGDHNATAIVPAAPAPDDIVQALCTDRALWGADRLAAWLETEAVPHAIRQARFFLVAG